MQFSTNYNPNAIKVDKPPHSIFLYINAPVHEGPSTIVCTIEWINNSPDIYETTLDSVFKTASFLKDSFSTLYNPESQLQLFNRDFFPNANAQKKLYNNWFNARLL